MGQLIKDKNLPPKQIYCSASKHTIQYIVLYFTVFHAHLIFIVHF